MDLLIKALEHSDNDRRLKRAERTVWISQYEIGGVIAGSVEVIHLLQEARNCFVEAHYIATLMLATAVIEHLISNKLLQISKAKYGISFERAIEIAREEKIFSSDLLDSADKLRQLRNPFAHLKPGNHESTLANRFVAQKRHPIAVVEDDAKEAVVAMYGYFDCALISE
ncbi:MAG TPA: hypothetical protein VK974_11960 [Methylophilaceae bacterium]|nr:hypothetical protein [Methylophilaceae bacterium]